MSSEALRAQFAQLMFYVREKYWHHAEELCMTAATASDNWLFRVWHALCLDQQGQSNDAMREYKAAEQRRDTVLPALMGMSIIYRRNHDETGLTTVEMKLSDAKYEGQIDGWVQAAAMCYAVGEIHAARDHLLKFSESKFGEHRDEYSNLGTIRGWVDLATGRGALLEKAGTAFQKVLDLESANNGGKLDLNAAMGRVAYLERKFQFTAAQDILNRLIVAYPTYLPALVLKARLLMRAEDWDQALETTRRLLTKDAMNVEALTLEALHALVKDSRFDAATTYLNKLLSALQTREPRNPELYYTTARAFARLSSNQLQVLNVTIQLAEQACRLDSRKGEYLCEVGYEQIYRGDYKAALATFTKAAPLAVDSLAPLMGPVICHIRLGKLDEASKLLITCNELQPANQRNAELSWLNGLLLWRLKKEQAKAVVCLDQAAEAVRQDMNAQGGTGGGLELYVTLNQPLMLWIGEAYMQHCRSEPPDPAFRQNDVVGEKARRHLELLTRHVPGCMEAQLMLAKIQFVSGDLNKAQSIIKSCLRHESPPAVAYLLSAQICQYMGNIKLASQSLEQALTLDFEIKDQPQYNLLFGVVQGMLNKAQPALDALQLALQEVNDPGHVTAKGRPIEPLSVPDHVTLYLQLAQAHLRLHDADEARNVLTEAANKFRQTNQAGRVSVAQAMLMARTDVDKAIATLREVPAKSDFFIPARTQMAKLYLLYRQNPIKYAECFEEMVEEVPSAQSFVELGEAYSTIQEPERAIAAYEKAQALAPNNSELSVRIGRALVSTHDYERAVRYYNTALDGDANLFSVRADLAMLHWHLGDPARAVQTLKDAPINKRTTTEMKDEDTLEAVERVNCALLLRRIYDGVGNAAGATEALEQARGYQKDILDVKLRSETRETLHQQKSILANIDVELARVAFAKDEPAFSRGLTVEKRENAHLQKAKEYLEEALRFDEGNEEAAIEMARWHLRSGDLEGCEAGCNGVLKMSPGCEDAVKLLAEAMLRHNDIDDASTHFQQLLAQKPDNYEALVQYVQLLCRAGRLPEAEAVIEKSESAVTRSAAGVRPDAGLWFAKGIVHHHQSANAEALRAFNSARLPTDNPWAVRALAQMIRIYLVPTTQDLWVDDWAVDEKTENAKSAEQLLLLLPMGETRQLLQAYCLVATKQKPDLEKAMHQFLTLIDMHANGGHAHTSPNQASLKLSAADKATQEEERLIEAEEARRRREDMDEDDLLLLETQQRLHPDAAVPGAATSPAARKPQATLQEALQCATVHIPSFLGLSITLYLSRQETAARNVLQRIFNDAPVPVDYDTLHELQRAQLFLAHMDTKANKIEEAEKTLRAVLAKDKSCGAAWDALGMLYERQLQHQRASTCYEKAWKLVKESDPAVGFKLAYNYLKGDLPVKAIDVSKTVLSQHTTYPCIEEEVMDVAYTMLRP